MSDSYNMPDVLKTLCDAGELYKTVQSNLMAGGSKTVVEREAIRIVRTLSFGLSIPQQPDLPFVPVLESMRSETVEELAHMLAPTGIEIAAVVMREVLNTQMVDGMVAYQSTQSWTVAYAHTCTLDQLQGLLTVLLPTCTITVIAPYLD